MKKITSSVFLICFLVLSIFIGWKDAFAVDFSVEEQPIPRFVSIKFDEVNGRFGPGKNYPVKFVLKKKNMPVKVIKEYEHWRLLELIDGDTVWLHKSQISGFRYGTLKNDGYENIYKNSDGEKVIAKVGYGNIFKIKSCKKSSPYCLVKIQNEEGFIKRNSIFGLLEGEDLD